MVDDKFRIIPMLLIDIGKLNLKLNSGNEIIVRLKQ